MKLKHTILTGLALFAPSLSLHATTESSEARASKPSGYFLSIDGVRPDYLRKIIAAQVLPSDKGLAWLYQNSLRADHAKPIGSTLTASSHVSNITCSTPSKHGIIANSFIEDNKMVSGFSHEIKSETLWQSAKRQGKKVLSVAYVGADGSNADRRADYGLAYPENRMVGQRSGFVINLNELNPARGWQLPENFCQQNCELLERRFFVNVNPATEERRFFNMLIKVTPSQTILVIDDDKDLTNGFRGKVHLQGRNDRSINLYFRERERSSPLHGYLRLVRASFNQSPDGRINVGLSRVTYNNAYPTSFRELLESKQLVWPDYGVGNNERVSPSEFIERHDLIGRFFTDVARVGMKHFDVDITLFYQPLVDSLGHAYEARLPKPFNPHLEDEITQAYVEAYRRIDINLSRLFAEASEQDVIMMLGDHGMDSVHKAVNLHPLRRQLPHQVRLVTSGSLLLMYAEPELQLADLADVSGQVMHDLLAQHSWQGLPVLGTSHRRADYSEQDWQYGDAVWAFTTGAGYWFTTHIGFEEVLIEPSPLGMHGQHPSLPSMATAFLLKAPGIAAQDIGAVHLIDAAPTFSELLTLEPPRDCEGTSLAGQLLTK